MDDVAKQALLSAIRTLLAAAGAWMATHKYIDADSVNEIIGALMIAIPILWGVWDKYQAERKTKAREVIAVNAGVAVADSTVGATPPVSPADSTKIIAAFVAPQPSMAEALNVVPPAVQPTTKGTTP